MMWRRVSHWLTRRLIYFISVVSFVYLEGARVIAAAAADAPKQESKKATGDEFLTLKCEFSTEPRAGATAEQARYVSGLL